MMADSDSCGTPVKVNPITKTWASIQMIKLYKKEENSSDLFA